MEERETTSMRELTHQEIDQVSGGVLPVVGMAIAAFGHFTARTAVSSAVGRLGFGVGVYELAKWVDNK